MAINFPEGTQNYPTIMGRTYQWTYQSVGDYGYVANHQDMPGNLGNGAANLTPLSTSSKILVEGQVHVGHEQTWRAVNFKMFRSIGGGGWVEIFGFCGGDFNNGSNILGSTYNTAYVDSPGTTSNVRYKMQYRGHSQGGDLHLNQSNFSNSTNNNNEGGCVSYIMLTEITE